MLRRFLRVRQHTAFVGTTSYRPYSSLRQAIQELPVEALAPIQAEGRDVRSSQQVDSGATATRRAKKAIHDGNALKPLRAGFTWLTKDPVLLDEGQILSIAPKRFMGVEMAKTVIVLVTPSLVPFLEAGFFNKDLLPALYAGRRSYGDSTTIEIKCIYAVVDAVPGPFAIRIKGEGLIPALKTQEGLAIFLSSDFARAKLSSQSPTMDLDASLEHASATIKFASATTPDPSPADGSNGRFVTRQIELPVANTLFINGQRKTFFEDRWKMKLSRTSKPVFEFTGRQDLESISVDLRCLSEQVVNGGSTPLQQLTKPRRVVRSMGNVLARLQIDDEDIPASQELEKAVSAFIKSNPSSTTQGALRVYALIRPESISAREEPREGDQRNSPADILGALWQGAKLFKVSGGGGGWGKRQGILSLEAAVDFEAQDAQSTIDMPNLDDELSLFKNFESRGIVSKGSTVEFLVYCPLPAAGDLPDEPGQEQPPSTPSQKDTTTIVLGTTVDPTSGDDLVQVPDSDTSVQFLPNHFGMISYGGAALKSMYSFPWSDSLPISYAQTRLDVPDSSFVFQTGEYFVPEQEARVGGLAKLFRAPHKRPLVNEGGDRGWKTFRPLAKGAGDRGWTTFRPLEQNQKGRKTGEGAPVAT